MADGTVARQRRGTASRLSGLLVPVLALGLTSCDVLGDDSGSTAHADAADIAQVAGWTRIALTPSYLLVVNVLPSERMYTPEEIKSMNPTEGEAIIDGPGNPVGVGVRHVEAHIYDRQTGLPLSDVDTHIRIFNRTTGDDIDVPPTLMQDVVIGSTDIHYGNNVPVQGSSDISVQVSVGDEEVSVDGHLD